MHIITYENGMSKSGSLKSSLKSKTAIRLKHSFIWQNSYMFIGYCKRLLAIVNVTYVTQCYDKN